MIAYLSKRLLSLIPVLVGITIFAFLIGVASPGDPSYMALTRDGISDPTEEEIQEKRHELGLDLPLHIQYINWTRNILKGDLGKSIYTEESIGDELKRRISVTFKLAIISLVITVTTSLLLGALMARFRYTFFDKVLRQLTTLFVSIPSFWMAIILITIFAEWFKILPTSGVDGPLSFVLPSLVLSLGSIGVSSRLARANFIGELNKQYVLIAHSKGLKGSTIGVTHILKNALIPLVTFFGIYFAGILGGAAVVETIFALPGLGSYVIEGIFNRDYFVIQAYVILTGTIYVTMNLVIDLLYFIINPEIRQGEGL